MCFQPARRDAGPRSPERAHAHAHVHAHAHAHADARVGRRRPRWATSRGGLAGARLRLRACAGVRGREAGWGPSVQRSSAVVPRNSSNWNAAVSVTPSCFLNIPTWYVTFLLMSVPRTSPFRRSARRHRATPLGRRICESDKAACLVAAAFVSTLLAAPPVAACLPGVLARLLPRLEAVVVVGGPMAGSVL